MMTLSDPFMEDWRNMTEVTLTSGITVGLPWRDDVAGNTPKESVEHLKGNFGWELMVSTLGKADVGLNYMLFRNVYTGMVRVFYYMEEDVNESDLRTFWRLNFQGLNSLANSAGIFYTPSNVKRSFSDIEISNLVLHESVNSLKRGWNSFETEVNYDPDLQANGVIFSIGSYNTATSNITITGDYNSDSKGTVIKNNTSNPVRDIVNSTVDSYGDQAKEWVDESIGADSEKNKPIKIGLETAGKIVKEGVRALAGSGISSLFGSFIGIFSKDQPEVHELSFTTTGEVQLNGELVNVGGNNAVDWNRISAVPLGVWAIEENPVIQVGKYGLYRGMPEVNGSWELEKRFKLDRNSLKVVLNKELEDNILSYSVSTQLLIYEKLNGNLNWRNDFNDLVPSQNWSELGVMPQQRVLYESDNHVIKDGGICQGNCEVRLTSTKPTGPFVLLNEGISKNVVVKVKLDFITKDGNEVSLSRTLLPEIELVDNSSNPFSTEVLSTRNSEEEDKQIKVTFK